MSITLVCNFASGTAVHRVALRGALNPWKIHGIVREPVCEFISCNVAAPSPNDVPCLHKVPFESEISTCDLVRADLLVTSSRLSPRFNLRFNLLTLAIDILLFIRVIKSERMLYINFVRKFFD